MTRIIVVDSERYIAPVGVSPQFTHYLYTEHREDPMDEGAIRELAEAFREQIEDPRALVLVSDSKGVREVPWR